MSQANTTDASGSICCWIANPDCACSIVVAEVVLTIVIQVLIGLVTTFIGFVIGSAWQMSHRRLSYWRARRFWRPFLASDIKVVIGKFNEFSGFEASGFVGMGDMQAAAEVVALFDDLGFRRSGHTLNIVYHDQLAGDLYGANLVCIGGPDANKVTDRILERLRQTIKTGDPKLHEISLHDAETGKSYAPKAELDGEGRRVITLDYGLLIKASNPFDSHSRVVIFSGCFGYGTWSGVKLTRMREFLRFPLVSQGASLECLYKVEVVEDTPLKPEVILIRQISS